MLYKSSQYGIQEQDLSLWKENLQQKFCGAWGAQRLTHPEHCDLHTPHLVDWKSWTDDRAQAASLSPEALAYQHVCRGIWIYAAGDRGVWSVKTGSGSHLS